MILGHVLPARLGWYPYPTPKPKPTPHVLQVRLGGTPTVPPRLSLSPILARRREGGGVPASSSEGVLAQRGGTEQRGELYGLLGPSPSVLLEQSVQVVRVRVRVRVSVRVWVRVRVTVAVEVARRDGDSLWVRVSEG